MLKSIYNKLRYLVSKDGEKGEASSGFLPPRVRERALSAIDIDTGDLLELGCGEGLFIIEAARRFPGMRITGVEISEDVLREAKRKVEAAGLKDINVARGSADKTGFEDGAFSRVICLNMLYNLASKGALEAVIREMKRICNKGGSIIFDIRNRSNPIVRLAYRNAAAYDPECPWPLNAYTLKEMEEMLKGCNMSIKRVFPVVNIFGLFPLAYIMEAVKS
ncbi:class I SAM-dependent methyltransferase [Candidatus Omnitrophota bacterium]